MDEAGDIRGIEHGLPYDYVLDARRLVEEIDQGGLALGKLAP